MFKKLLLALFLFPMSSFALAQSINFNLNNIIDSVVTSLEEPKKSSSPTKSNQQKYNLKTRKNIQRNLNQLGFNAGIADGVFGPKTRTAISEFQRSIGSTPTGSLKKTELNQLMSMSLTNTQPTSNSPPQFRILDGFDLAGNDYRHTGTDRSLANLTSNQCINACQADRNCKAFTYNKNAKWCFLKNKESQPTKFSAALSGIKLNNATFSQNTASNQETQNLANLSKQEMQDFQELLNKLGYDIGVADGVTRTKTLQSILNFINDRGLDSLETSTRQAYNLAQKELGIPIESQSLRAPNSETAKYLSYKDLFLLFYDHNKEYISEATSAVNFAHIIEDPNGFSQLCKSINKIDNSIAARREVNAIIPRFNASLNSGRMSPPPNNLFKVALSVRSPYRNYDYDKGAIYTEVWRRLGFSSTIYDGRPQLKYRPCRSILELVRLADIREKNLLPTIYNFNFQKGILDRLEVTGGSFAFSKELLGHIKMSPEKAESIISRNSNQKSMKIEIVFSFTPLSPYAISSQGIRNKYGEVSMRNRTHKYTVHSISYIDNLTGETLFYLDVDSIAFTKKVVDGENLPSFYNNPLFAGLKYFDGAILLPKRSSSNIEVRALQNLFSMLVLKSNPSLGRSSFAGRYIPLLGSESLSYGTKYEGKEDFVFAGTNEFERRDSINLWKTEGLPKLLKLTPDVPFDYISMKRITFGLYNMSQGYFPYKINNSERMEINSINVPGDIASPSPFTWSNRWYMPKDEARKFITNLSLERQKFTGENKNYRNAYIAIRKRVDSIQITGSKQSVLNLSLVSMDLYVDPDFQIKISSMPFPKDARLASDKDFSFSKPQYPPSLDVETLRMLLAKQIPDLLSQPDYIKNSLKIRQKIEREEDSYPTSISPILPAFIVKTEAVPSEENVKQFKDWYKKAIDSLDSQIRFPFGIMANLKDSNLNINLAETLNNARIRNPIFRLTKSTSLIEFAKSSFPDATGYAQIPTENDILAAVAFKANPAWFDLKMPAPQISSFEHKSGYADFKITNIITQGNSVIILEVEPTKVTYNLNDDDQITINIASAENLGSKIKPLDILGVSLGMPIKQAQDIISKANENIPEMKMLGMFKGKGLVLNGGVQFIIDSKSPEQIGIFTDESGKNVVGVTRYVDASEVNITPKQIVNSLISKYGQPDADNLKDNAQSYFLAWGESPTSKAKISRFGVDYKCILYPHRGYRTDITKREIQVNTSNIEERCGTYIAAFVSKDSTIEMMLLNSDLVIEKRRQKQIIDQQKREEEAKKIAPQIKF